MALVATAVRDGFKSDLRVLGAVLLDVARTAWRLSEPEIETGIVALTSSLTSNPLVKVAETLVVAELEKAAAPAAAPAIAA